MTWVLGGTCVLLAGYSVLTRRRIRELRSTVRTLRRQLTSARFTKQMVQETRDRLERTLAALTKDRDEMRELLTAKAGHVFDLPVDVDPPAYLERMAAYDGKAGTP